MKKVDKTNTNRKLYESIMRDVAKIVKKHLNENVEDFIKVEDLEMTELPRPVVLLKKLVSIFPANAELMGIWYRDRYQPEFKVEIGINCDFEFLWTINIELTDEPEKFEVFAFNTVDGLENEVADGDLTLKDFKEQVLDVIKESIKDPESWNEYRYDEEDI